MKRTSPNRTALGPLLAGLLLVASSPAVAQEAAPPGEPGPGQAPADPSQEREEPPPPAEPTAAPAEQGAAPDGEGQAAASEGGDEVSPLVPEQTVRRMATHPVLGDTIYYKPGSGVVVESEDGQFALGTRVRAQFLYTWEHDEVSGDDGHSFEIRRARVTFAGHFFGEDNRFKMELAVAPDDIDIEDAVGVTLSPLLDAYLDFTHLRDLQVRVGQYKVPFSRERVISSGDLEFVDRSLTNAAFNVDRDIGFDIRSRNFLGLDMLRYYAGIYVGEGRDAYRLDEFNMMYLARVEFLPFGMFEDYEQGDFARTLSPRLSIGVGYAFLDDAQGMRGIRGPAPDDGGTTDYHVGTADAVFMYGGASVTVESFLRFGDRNPPAGQMPDPTAARDGYGITGQMGYLIPHLPVGVAARYSAVRGTGSTSQIDQNELGFAVGWYFAQHVFKLQADFFRLWDDSLTDGEDVLRLQLQASI